MKSLKSGFVQGTGAAIDVEVGFVPDVVIVTNVTDGDVINVGWPSVRTMAFTSGGTAEIKAGHTVIGATSGATAMVRQVLAGTGTWAGGDAAGTIILHAETITGSFTAENIFIAGGAGSNDATGAALATPGVDIDTEVAGDTGVSAYPGSQAVATKGFTLGSGISEVGKLLHWAAWREG